MTRNLKALGLALVAVFAMSAVAASSASALSDFTSPAGYPQTLVTEDVGDPDGVHLASNYLVCANEQFDGDLTGEATFIDLTPTLINCKTEGAAFNNVTVTHNSCRFRFSTSTTIATDEDGLTVSIVGCAKPEQGIELHHYSSAANHAAGTSSCTNTITPQTLSGHLIGTSNTGPGDILLEGKVGINVRLHGACSFGLTVTTEGSYTFSTTVNTLGSNRIHLG